jgi:hypothetical protein
MNLAIMRMRKGRVAKLGRMQTGRMHVLAMGLQCRRGLESILRRAADEVEVKEFTCDNGNDGSVLY